MTAHDILSALGQFSQFEVTLLEKHIDRKTVTRNEIVLSEGAICQSVFYVLSGSFVQSQPNQIAETIIDLHLPNEWVFNQQSLVEQRPSKTTIRAFEKSVVIELSLRSIHTLIAQSPSFLMINKILNQPQHRTYLFDNPLSPAEKYRYIQKAKPLLVLTFPIKMIASYLKIAPETLSRVRADYSIS